MDGERAPFAPNTLGAIPGEVTVTLGEAAFNRSVVKAGHTDRRFVLDLQDAFTDAVCEAFEAALAGTPLIYRVLWTSGADDPTVRVKIDFEPETAEQNQTFRVARKFGVVPGLSQELANLIQAVFGEPDWVKQTPMYAGMAIAVTLDQGDAA